MTSLHTERVSHDNLLPLFMTFYFSGGIIHGRHILGACPADPRHRSGADHQGSVFLAVHRCGRRRALRRGRFSRGRAERSGHRLRRAGRHDLRRGEQRRHFHLPGAAWHHRSAGQSFRRLRGLRALGGEKHQDARRRHAGDLCPRHPDLYRRLFQLPDRRFRYASGHRQPQDQPQQACLSDRRHGSARVHDRSCVLLGCGGLRHGG